MFSGVPKKFLENELSNRAIFSGFFTQKSNVSAGQKHNARANLVLGFAQIDCRIESTFLTNPLVKAKSNSTVEILQLSNYFPTTVELSNRRVLGWSR